MPYEEKGATLQDLLFQFHSGYDCYDFTRRIIKHNFTHAMDYIRYVINDKDELRKEENLLIKQIRKMETDEDYGYMALAYQICTRIANGDCS